MLCQYGVHANPSLCKSAEIDISLMPWKRVTVYLVNCSIHLRLAHTVHHPNKCLKCHCKQPPWLSRGCLPTPGCSSFLMPASDFPRLWCHPGRPWGGQIFGGHASHNVCKSGQVTGRQRAHSMPEGLCWSQKEAFMTSLSCCSISTRCTHPSSRSTTSVSPQWSARRMAALPLCPRRQTTWLSFPR
jgi:hypothetical protein